MNETRPGKKFGRSSAMLVVLVITLIVFASWVSGNSSLEQNGKAGAISYAPSYLEEHNGDINNDFLSDNTALFLPEGVTPDVETSLTPTLTPSPDATAIPSPVLTATPKPAVTVKPTVKPTVQPTVQPTPTPVPVVTTPPPTVPPLPTTPPPWDYSHPRPVSPGCPASTQNCVPCTSGSSCRFEPGETHGFLGWACQDNNPGNIRNASTNMSTDFKNLMIIRNGGTPACGVRYDSRGGSYFIFPNYEAGFGALKAYLKGINNGEHSSYKDTANNPPQWVCGNCTLTQFFSKYSPGGYEAYANAVGAEIGVDPTTTTIAWVVANKLDGFATAIKKHEGWFVQ
jgi:hypothetical protein